MAKRIGWGRLIELFEDVNGVLSLTRLLMFMSWIPATIVLVRTKQENVEAIFGMYVGAFVLGYLGGKGWETLGPRNNGGQIVESVQVDAKSSIRSDTSIGQ